MRERPGRDDNHKLELEKLERRMLDEHFFLYNDVPDTGMWREASKVQLVFNSWSRSVRDWSDLGACWMSLGDRGAGEAGTSSCDGVGH